MHKDDRGVVKTPTAHLWHPWERRPGWSSNVLYIFSCNQICSATVISWNWHRAAEWKFALFLASQPRHPETLTPARQAPNRHHWASDNPNVGLMRRKEC